MVITSCTQSQTESLTLDNVQSFIPVSLPSNTNPEELKEAVLLEKAAAYVHLFNLCMVKYLPSVASG